MYDGIGSLNISFYVFMTADGIFEMYNFLFPQKVILLNGKSSEKLIVTRSPAGLKDFRACKKQKQKTITKFLLLPPPPSNGGLTLYGKKLHAQQK